MPLRAVRGCNRRVASALCPLSSFVACRGAPGVIPFLDLKSINLAHRAELVSAFERVIDSGWYIMGAELGAFEKEYAEYCSARECVGVANGLDALTLSLRALGVGPGDEVIVPSN